jgi:hypothetical protein
VPPQFLYEFFATCVLLCAAVVFEVLAGGHAALGG